MTNNDSNGSTQNLDTPAQSQSAAAASPAPACAVKTPTIRVAEYVPPRNDVEAFVAEILAQLLKMEQVGVNDNLILLGGESLLAAQAAWHIRNRYGCEVSLRSILTGTVAKIATEIIAATHDAE
jgi:hypothetical protein